MNNKIIAQIASMPARVETLEKTVNSLINQVDMLFVALNGYQDVPHFLNGNMKIAYAMLDNILGDGAKFYDVSERNGYILTCDDDLVYPSGYAQRMVDGVKRHGGFVSLLGKVYSNRPIGSYSGGYTTLYHCLYAVNKDVRVDVVGTGVMAYHSDTIKIDPYKFPRKNMADVWIAKLAHENNIPLTVLSHPRGYLKHTTYSWRIWAKDRDDRYATKVVNSFLKPSIPERG